LLECLLQKLAAVLGLLGREVLVINLEVLRLVSVVVDVWIIMDTAGEPHKLVVMGLWSCISHKGIL
jgi:hypothetical protein